MNGFLVVLACSLAIACAMTTVKMPHHSHNGTHTHNGTHGTHPPHHHGTHAPHIGEGFVFKYDQAAQRMAIISNHTCWIYNPSDDEKSHIGDIHVLRTLEVKLIQLIDTNPTGTSLSHDDLVQMSASLGHTCRPTFPIVTLN